jgi:zinc transport system permease protein
MDDFVLRAAAAGIGVAIVAAPLGCFIVWRRLSYFGATIAHGGLLGVALGFLLGVDLTLGVAVTAIALAALLTGLERQRMLPSDALLGILSHAALALGLILAGLLAGKRLDLMGYLFGDILAVSEADLYWIWGGGAVVMALVVWLWRPLLALSIHPELAQAEGVRPRLVEAAFIVLLAFTVAAAMKIVGILLITSMLVIPAAAARAFARTPEQMAVGAAIVGAASVLIGLGVSLVSDIATGPAIVVASAALFAASLPFAAGRG